MKAAVISGGGSWGAYTAGYLEKAQPEYEVVVGTSTGALMAPFAVLGLYHELASAYSGQTNKDVWDFRPVKRNGKLRTAAILRFAFTSRTFGKSDRLLKTIRRIYSREIHEMLQKSTKKAVVCVYNMDKHKQEFKLLNSFSWEDATEWMYISACAPMLMSLPKKDGQYYSDGGLASILPLTFTAGYTESLATTDKQVEIDAFIHRTKIDVYEARTNRVVSNLDNLSDTLKALELNTVRQNIALGEITASTVGSKVHKIYMPETPDFSPMWFSKSDMARLVEAGRIHAILDQKIKNLRNE